MINKNIVVGIFTEASNAIHYLKRESILAKDDSLESYIYFEFIFLFIHLISREILRIAPERRDDFIDNLAGDIIGGYIHVKVVSLSESDRKKLTENIFQKLNDAEQKYQSCIGLLNEENPLSDNAVLPLFSKNIANLTDNKDDLFTVLKIIEITLFCWDNLKVLLPKRDTVLS